MKEKITKTVKSLRQIEKENQEEISNQTLQLQRTFSLSIAVLYFLYTASLMLTDWFFWHEWYWEMSFGLLIAFVAAINWWRLKKVEDAPNSVVWKANLFLFVLLQIISMTRCFSNSWISYSLTTSTIVATAVVSLHPVSYTLILASATLSESMIRWKTQQLPFPAMIYEWLDIFLIFLVTIEIHYLVTALRYRLIEEQSVLRKESILDALTGLYTRKYFERYFQLHYREDELSAMVHLDLDNFKKLNDTLGHKQGDELLIRVAGILRTCIRKTDCVARVGGDEFMIFMGSLSERTNATDRIQQVLDQFPILIQEGTQSVPVSVSIGVVFSIPGKQSSYQELYQRADGAMYQAKRGGKGRAALIQREEEELQWLLSKNIQ